MRNPILIPIDQIELIDENSFYDLIFESINEGGRVASYFPYIINNKMYLLAVILFDQTGSILVFQMLVEKKIRSISKEFPQLYNFEREIYEEFGKSVIDSQHLNYIRFSKEDQTIGKIDFYKIDSEEIHEVGVGPVHAGIIEPGHFRFQCVGEKVLFLEISLGYQHRGIERHLIHGPHKDSYYQIQALSGDSTIAHTWAYINILEKMQGMIMPDAALLQRTVALELERVANHVGDLGALANDVGFLPTSSYCGRIRGDFLNMTAFLCGNRFGRNLIRAGQYLPLDKSVYKQIIEKIDKVSPQLHGAVKLMWDTPSVMSRLENTGILPQDIASELGVVGVTAKASSVAIDIRKDFPFGLYKDLFKYTEDTYTSDVYARGLVRWHETQNSIAMIKEALYQLMKSNDTADNWYPSDTIIKKNCIIISLTEGFRGEVCHTAVIGNDGRFIKYKIVDPSFHNWPALAYVMRGEGISDFPLCNKSFNLSYCGFDL